jgi:hypothetical protein
MLALCMSLLGCNAAGTASRAPSAPLAALETPVPVRFDAADDIFPEDWKTDEVRASASPIRDEEKARTLRILGKAMAKYPESLLQRNLKAVYVVRSMSFFGLPYGGTNSLDTIYLCNDGLAAGFDDAYLESAFHHELSSIFLRNFAGRFEEDLWLASNPDGFRYGNGGDEAVRTGQASIVYDPALFPDGFLMQYAKASLEEDFNTVAEALLLGDPAFWRAVDRSPRLLRKCRIAMDFYGRLDPKFTEAYFRGL